VPGDIANVSTVVTSGIEVVEADKITLIYDAKGKPGQDSFFEAYVKEVLSE
jgi:AAA family ATPase